MVSTSQPRILGQSSSTVQQRLWMAPVSLNLFTGSNGSNGAEFRTQSFAGTVLSDVTALSYNTFATQWNGQQLPYLIIWVDYTGDGVKDDRFFFEPITPKISAVHFSRRCSTRGSRGMHSRRMV